ncbi:MULTISPECIES: hypothetical protein [Streptomyces]|uniref:hypothetical protein n=1 Tax=Streptomyces TaxID=1883 RepID=UPI0004AB39A0|nr:MULTISPECIES: hypothetical protein [Streptomyces]
MGSGSTGVGGDLHHDTVDRRGGLGVLVGVLVVVAGLIALGLHYLDGPRPVGPPAGLPATVEGEAMRWSSADGRLPDREGEKAYLVRMGLVDPQAADYGEVPEAPEAPGVIVSGSGGKGPEARWNVIIAGSSPAFQRMMVDGPGGLAGATKSASPHAKRQVETFLGGRMYCDGGEPGTSAEDVKEPEAFGCLWTDGRFVILASGRGRAPKLLAAVVERIHRGTER